MSLQAWHKEMFCSLIPRSFVDILSIASSCGELQLLFQACESELSSLDTSINAKKIMLHPYRPTL